MLDSIDRTMRNNNRDPIFILSNKGEFIDIKDDFCREVGCTKGEILGKHIEEVDFLTDDTREKMRSRCASSSIDREAVVQDFEVITRKGDILSIELDATPVSKDGEIVGEMATVRKTNLTMPDKLKRRKPVRNEINEMQIELNKKQEEIKSIDAELETRNTIISEIKRQLTEKQMNLVEKTGFVDQLQTEIQQRSRELKLKSEELGVAKLEIEERTKEIDHIRLELENKNRELLERNVKINQLKTRLEEMTEEVNASKSALKWFKIELEQKQEELQSMNTELETRNAIISEIKKQLTERQTDFIDKTKDISELQAELERKQEEIDNLNIGLQGFSLAGSGKIAGDLTSIRTEINRIDGVLKEKQTELETLDKSIELKTKELDDLNLKLEESVSALKLAESQLGRKQMEQVAEGTHAETHSSEILRERLKIYDEIDRCLDSLASGDIKTKKIEEDSEKV